jgi:putative acetyltransferase
VPPLRFLRDDLRGPEARALAEQHFAEMLTCSPDGCAHAFPLDRLRAPDVAVWAGWRGPTLACLGALRRLDAENGELKAMRVADPLRGQGHGRALLEHLLAEARAAGLRAVWLETGSSPVFAPALRLYARAGFTPCGPFGEHRADGFSVFLRMELSPMWAG